MSCILEAPLDYAEIRRSFPQLSAMNEYGTCAAMSCKWAALILSSPQFPARSRIERIRDTVGQLALAHRRHLTRLDQAPIDQKARAYADTYAGFELRCDDLTGENAQPIGVSRFPDPDMGESLDDWRGGEWLGCQAGDMWGVIGAFLRLRDHEGKAFLLHYYTGPRKQSSQGGHALAAYVVSTNPSVIRVFDMNDGESLITGEAGWRSFCDTLDLYNGKATRDRGINFVDVHPVRAI